MEDRIKSVMAVTLNLGSDDIHNDASPETIASWDSLRHMTLIMALEDEFGIRFTDDQIPTLLNYRIIVDSIETLLRTPGS